MSRFPSHTVESAPEASRLLLQKIAQASPTGRPLNVHAQICESTRASTDGAARNAGARPSLGISVDVLALRENLHDGQGRAAAAQSGVVLSIS
jgi:hypothetical protein